MSKPYLKCLGPAECPILWEIGIFADTCCLADGNEVRIRNLCFIYKQPEDNLIHNFNTFVHKIMFYSMECSVCKNSFWNIWNDMVCPSYLQWFHSSQDVKRRARHWKIVRTKLSEIDFSFHIPWGSLLGSLISLVAIQMKVSVSMGSFTTKTKTALIFLILSVFTQNGKLPTYTTMSTQKNRIQKIMKN